MAALNLSFRVNSIGLRGGLLLIVFAVVVLMLPVGYAAWYLFLGGQQAEITRQLQPLVGRNPVRDAQDAVKQGDYRLITVTKEWEDITPGFGLTDPKWKKLHGFRPLGLFDVSTQTPVQKYLNATGLAYAEAYNRAIVKAASPLAQASSGGIGPVIPASQPGHP